jgi:uncharacterized protein with LGFP repeats
MTKRFNEFFYQRSHHLLLVAVIISSTLLFGTFNFRSSQPARAAAISRDVLVIHGLNGYNTSPSSQYYGYDCTGTADPNGNDLAAADNGNGSPGDAVNVLNANGWNAVPIGYYADPGGQSSPPTYQKGDYDCLGYLASESSHCTGVPVGTQGSNNEDLRHLGCELAWYIFDHYTSNDEEVRVLAHSMGGLIIRWALYKNQFQSNPSTYDSNYPPYVYVPAVVTLGTPHGGVVGAGLPTFGLCDQCLQAGQMDPNDSANFLQLMMQNGLNPQGSTGTIWSNIGSADDEALTQGGLSPNYVSAFDMDSQNKYVYSYPDSSTLLPYFPGYTHGGLFADESSAQDAQIKACLTSCPPSIDAAVKNYPLLSSQFHSLELSAHLLNTPPPSIPLPYPVYNVPGGGAFYTVWQQVGGISGALGKPTDAWYTITGGQEQDFQGGRIYWSPSTGTHEVQGAILSEYLHMGGPAGSLNFPTSNEQNAYNSSGAAIGRENTFRGTGCTASNQGSIILWSSSTGAHEVGGCIYQKYVNLGGTRGFLGLPTSDEVHVGSGHVSYFQGTACGSSSYGGIFDGPGAGVHEVHGCIYQKYAALGGPTGSLNYPTSDEQNAYDSSGAAVGRENTFLGTGCTASNQGSFIISSGNGTYEVGGCIYQKYVALGGTRSFLGLPTSDEAAVGSGHASYFQGTGCGSSTYGAIYDEPGAGTYSIHGCVYQHYLSLLNAGVPLGYPTSDEQNVYNSSGVAIGRENTFSGSGIGCGSNTGSAIISDSVGTYVVESCIYQAYVKFGGAASALGLPIIDQFSVSGDYESDFQGGYITYNPSTGQTSIFLNSPGCGPVGANC